MKDLDYSKINESTQKRILKFLNRAKNPEDIAGKEPKNGPIKDHKRGPISGYDIGNTVANRIIEYRNELPKGEYNDIRKLNNIEGFGQDKLNDIAYSFGDDFEITHRIADELNKPGLSDNLKRLHSDQHNRLINKITPEVLSIKDNFNKNIAPFPGSVTLFVAKKGNELFKELKEGFEKSDETRIKKLGEKLRDIAQAREVKSVSEAVNSLIKSKTYFDISYGDKPLAPNLGLINDIEIASLNFAYNGGELNDKDFKIIEYCDPRFCDPSPEGNFDYLIIKRPPILDEIEKEVLQAVPANQLELNIGSVAACPYATVVIVIIYIAITAAGKTCSAFRDKLAEVTLPPERIKQIGKLASARELLNMRREVFREFGL